MGTGDLSWRYNSYMSWLDERLAERDAIRKRESQISAGASALYGAVWDCMAEIINEAIEKGFSLSCHEVNHNRIIHAGPANVEPQTVTLKLPKKPLRVSADGRGFQLSFDIDVCPDGLTCLKHKGEIVTPERAAKMILLPFLFPELK